MIIRKLDPTYIFVSALVVLVGILPAMMLWSDEPKDKMSNQLVSAGQSVKPVVMPAVIAAEHNPNKAKRKEENQAKELKELVASQVGEIRTLLIHLKAYDRGKHDRIIKHLTRSAIKLEKSFKRDKRLYNIDLKILKTEVKRDLEVAKLKQEDSKRSRNFLNDFLHALEDLKVLRMEMEKLIHEEQRVTGSMGIKIMELRITASKKASNLWREIHYMDRLHDAGLAAASRYSERNSD